MDFNIKAMLDGDVVITGDDLTASIVSYSHFATEKHPIIIKNSSDGFSPKDRPIYDASISKSTDKAEWERIIGAFII